MKERVWYGLAVMLLASAPLAAQVTAMRPDSSTLSYPMTFDTVETYLRALIPPEHRDSYRNIQLSADGFKLRVDADVKLGAIPGFEMFAAMGWAHVTGIGPVQLVRPGLIGWDMQTVQVNGQGIAEMLWAPVIRRATRRSDTILPFKVGTWVTRVTVEPTLLRLHKT